MASGLDLKVDRVRARVSATDLAVQMQVSRQRVSQVETFARVSEDMEARYREALLQVAERAQNAQEVA